jgi:hypothetical protein
MERKAFLLLLMLIGVALIIVATRLIDEKEQLANCLAMERAEFCRQQTYRPASDEFKPERK